MQRSIAYYKDLQAEVIYCDSTDTIYDGYLPDNIKYYHLPGKLFHEKILYVLDFTITEYIALCADDDFILKSSLYKGAEVLLNQPHFQTVLGERIAFRDNFDGVFYSSTKKLGSDLTYDKDTNAKLFFENYPQVLWAMYNKQILVRSFEIIKKADYSNDNFIELTLGAIACSLGGIKYLNDIWGAREISTAIHWGNRHKTIFSIYNDKNIRNDFNNFRKLTDSVVHKGYADLVLKSYLKLTASKKIKLIFIGVVSKIMHKSILRIVKKTFVKKHNIDDAYSKYPNLQKAELALEVKVEMREIQNLLERNV